MRGCDCHLAVYYLIGGRDQNSPLEILQPVFFAYVPLESLRFHLSPTEGHQASLIFNEEITDLDGCLSVGLDGVKKR